MPRNFGTTHICRSDIGSSRCDRCFGPLKAQGGCGGIVSLMFIGLAAQAVLVWYLFF